MHRQSQFMAIFFWEHGKKMELVDLEVSYGGFKQTHQIFFGGWAPTR